MNHETHERHEKLFKFVTPQVPGFSGLQQQLPIHSKIIFGKASEQNFARKTFVLCKLSAGADRDFCRSLLWIPVHARADAGKRNAATVVLLCEQQ